MSFWLTAAPPDFLWLACRSHSLRLWPHYHYHYYSLYFIPFFPTYHSLHFSPIVPSWMWKVVRQYRSNEWLSYAWDYTYEATLLKQRKQYKIIKWGKKKKKSNIPGTSFGSPPVVIPLAPNRGRLCLFPIGFTRSEIQHLFQGTKRPRREGVRLEANIVLNLCCLLKIPSTSVSVRLLSTYYVSLTDIRLIFYLLWLIFWKSFGIWIHHQTQWHHASKKETWNYNIQFRASFHRKSIW